MTAPSQPLSPEAARSGDVRENLRRYADLGGFTMTPETHAWSAAAAAVGTSEDARAASTVLAELRSRDLPAVRDAATKLASGTGLEAPDTVETTGRAVALLLRVRSTLATLSPEAYDEAGLADLVAATAGRAWRDERGVQLSWPRRRSLRGRARALAVARWPRRGPLHAALAAAAEERAEWADLVPEGGGPALPRDAAFLDGAARAVEAAAAGLEALGRLLSPEQDLGQVGFAELTDLLDRLAADEGTLHRLPTLRALREDLEERGHGDLLDDLASRRADTAEALAALPGAGPDPVPAPRTPAESTPDTDTVPAPRSEGTPATPEAASTAEAEADVAAEPAAEPEPGSAPSADADADAAEAEAEQETLAESVPQADAEPEAVAEPDAKPEPAPEPEAAAEAEPESAAAPAATPEPEAKPEPEAAAAPEPEQETAVEAEAKPEPAVEPEAEAEPSPEPEAAAEPEPQAEAQPEPTPDTEPEPESQPAAESEPQSQPEPQPESAPQADAEPQAAVEPEAKPEPEPEAAAEPAPAPAPAPQSKPAAGGGKRGRKPAITPGRPVTAYSSQELVAVVRWIDGDSIERTDDELLRAAMKELGFARLGPRIKEALGAAVAEVRG